MRADTRAQSAYDTPLGMVNMTVHSAALVRDKVRGGAGRSAARRAARLRRSATGGQPTQLRIAQGGRARVYLLDAATPANARAWLRALASWQRVAVPLTADFVRAVAAHQWRTCRRREAGRRRRPSARAPSSPPYPCSHTD